MEIVEDEGNWVASVPDLPGCNSFGSTVTEAIGNVQEAKELWIKSQLESGGQIPEPTDEEDFSGKFVLRIPKLLHRALAYQAQKQGVSLNHYVSHLLSERHSLNMVQSLLQTRGDFWQNAWVRRHQTPRYKFVSMGGTLPGDVTFVMHLRKPAIKFKEGFKIPRSLKEEYLAR